MSVALRYSGRWRDLDAASRRALLGRSVAVSDEVRLATQAIIADVRTRGDLALREMAFRFDGVMLESLEVPRAAIGRALASLDTKLRNTLERAASNIAVVHAAFKPVASRVEPRPGITIQRSPHPLVRVGVYAPGGRASYPSSVLMAAVPARVAGVGEVILASPPDQSGAPPAAVLAAAAIAEVDRVFAIGGAGAVAALAYGTETVPRVDRIVGPGNAYVAAAKAMVAGRVAIDCPAGPSELVVIADDSSDLGVVAREMTAQAEHDPLAVVVALVVGAGSAAALAEALGCVPATSRDEISRASLRDFGGVLEVRDLDEAMSAASEIAPEHLLIAVAGAAALAESARNAGSVFAGASSSVAFGDYMTGANHVLPTGGSARSYSGLSPLDFVRWTTIQSVTPAAAAAMADDVARFANAEGLPAHAAAAAQWRAR